MTLKFTTSLVHASRVLFMSFDSKLAQCALRCPVATWAFVGKLQDGQLWLMTIFLGMIGSI